MEQWQDEQQTIFVRNFKKQKQSKKIHWYDDFKRVIVDLSNYSFRKKYKSFLTTTPFNDLATLSQERIKSRNLHEISDRKSVWGIEICIYGDLTQDEGEIPYFPLLYICVDQQNNLILDSGVLSLRTPINKVYDKLANLMAKLNKIPQQIQCLNPSTIQSLGPLCSALGIKLKNVSSIPALEDYINKSKEMNLETTPILFIE